MKRRRIFISSVQKELVHERAALRSFLQADPLFRKCFDVFLFEDLPAKDRRSDHLYISEVDRCDVYLGIFGDEYGSITSHGKSPTELEFERASRQEKTRLIFIKGQGDSSRHPKMLALIQQAGKQLIRRRFSDIPELNAAVYASLIDYLETVGAIQTGPFDATVCPLASIHDLSPQKIKRFLTRAREERSYPLEPSLPILDALQHLRLVVDAQPTNAAILLFGKNPQQFLVTSSVKCLHFHGTEVQKPIPSYQTYRGTVFEMADQALDFVMSKINASVGTRAASNRAPLTYELPRDAVSEAIVNAIVHRDYTSNASVQVMLFSDRLEIWNPGELPHPLTFKSLHGPHPSIPRNPLIAEPMYLTRYIEKAGTGTLDIDRLCREAGLPAPEFREELGQFIQVIQRPIKPRTKLSTWRKAELATTSAGSQPRPVGAIDRLLFLLVDGPKSMETLRTELGFAHRSNFRNNYVSPAIKLGLVELTVPDKPSSRFQMYRLTSKGRRQVNTRNASESEE